MPPRRKKQVNKSTPPSSSPASSPSSSSAKPQVTSPRIPLPFTLADACANPEQCRRKVNRVVWEEEVVKPLMKQRYEEDEPVNWTKEINVEKCLAEDQLARIYRFGLLIARLHANIARAVLGQHYIGGTFEGWWKSRLMEEDRLGFLQAALDAACGAGKGYGLDIRLNCPDIDAHELAKDGGKGFISILRQIVQSAQTFKNQEDYYPIISEEFDRYHQIDRKGITDGLPQDRAVRTFQVIEQHDRMWFISGFVFSVLKFLNYAAQDRITGALLYKSSPKNRKPYNRGREIVEISTEPQSRREAQAAHDFESSNEGCLPGMFRGDEDAYKALHASPLHACHCCRRVAAEVEELKEKGKEGKMFYCGRCLALSPSHHFAYCSLDCQKHDYKHGGHKLVCGKLFTDLALPPMGWQMPPSLPPLTTMLQYQFYTIEKEADPKSPIHKVYHLRYYVDGPPHPEGPDGTTVDWNRECVCLAAYDRSIWDQQVNRAIASRKEEDLKPLALGIYNNIVVNNRTELIEDGIRQFADDWEIEESTVRGWIEEFNRNETLGTLARLFSSLAFSPSSDRGSKGGKIEGRKG